MGAIVNIHRRSVTAIVLKECRKGQHKPYAVHKILLKKFKTFIKNFLIKVINKY